MLSNTESTYPGFTTEARNKFSAGITLFDKKIIAIPIISKEIANSFKEYFEILWTSNDD